MTPRTLLLLLAALPGPAAALTPVEAFTSDRGVTYVEVAPEVGVALMSTAPVLYRVGPAVPAEAQVETLALLDDCSAESTLLGRGRWSQGAQGVVLMFPALVMTFPRGPASLGTRCGG